MTRQDTLDSDPARRRRSLWLLAALGLLSALLSGFLWRQLLVARAGGTPVCGFGDEGACGALWDSGFASAVHETTGVPVAGWGLVWGIVALALPLLALAVGRARDGGHRSEAAVRAGVEWVALGGLVATVVLAGVSVTQGIFCAGCVGTYVLALAYFAAAWMGLGGGLLPQPLGPGLGTALGATVLAFLVLLIPGLRTPKSTTDALQRTLARTDQGGPTSGPAAPPVVTPAPESTEEREVTPAPPETPAEETEDGGASKEEEVEGPEGEASPRDGPGEAPELTAEEAREQLRAQIDRRLWDYVLELDGQSQQILADALYVYRSSPIVPAREPRILLGPKDAPVRITDFTDIRCPACAQLHANLEVFQQVVPPGTFSLEPRHFPLDGRCNPLVPKERPEPIRCQAAKALVCLERIDDPRVVTQVQSRLFELQQQLDTELLFSTTDPHMERSELQACMDSPETEAKLREDIRWAEQHHIQGTPLVLLNGRKASSFGVFLYVILLNEGNPEHPAFDQLPPPSSRVTG